MFPILQIGPLALQVPGLVLLIGFWLGLSMMEKLAPKHKLKADTLYNLAFTAIVAGIIGARLAYAGRFPSAFAQSPASLISLNPGLLDVFGGLVFAGLAAFIYGQRKSLPFWQTMDILVPTFGMMVIAIALSNLASGRGFGAETVLPWGIELWGAVRHPSQIYEAAAGLFILVFLWPLIQQPGKRRPGTTFLLFLIFTALTKTFLETFRGDSLTILNGLRTSQVVAWMVLAAALWLYEKRTAKASN